LPFVQCCVVGFALSCRCRARGSPPRSGSEEGSRPYRKQTCRGHRSRASRCRLLRLSIGRLCDQVAMVAAMRRPGAPGWRPPIPSGRSAERRPQARTLLPLPPMASTTGSVVCRSLRQGSTPPNQAARRSSGHKAQEASTAAHHRKGEEAAAGATQGARPPVVGALPSAMAPSWWDPQAPDQPSATGLAPRQPHSCPRRRQGLA